MKTRKAIVLGLFAVLITVMAASCASTGQTQASQEDETGIIMTILEGLTESTQEAREIQRRLTAEQKKAFLESHANVSAADPGLALVKEAKGVEAKLAQILENLKGSTQTIQEREQARRAEIDAQAASVNPYIQARQDNQ